MPRSHRPARRHAAGFNLVELMIASAIGLMILAGMSTLFVNNNHIQTEIERSNRQIENGRYGMQLLSTDLSNAGFYGEFDPTPLPSPATLPDICATGVDQLREALPLPVQGIDQSDTSVLSCLPDRKDGTDVLVVRRTQTCVAGTGNCGPIGAGGAFLQASLCESTAELGSSNVQDHFKLDTDTTGMTLRKSDCLSTSIAAVRRYVVNIYYIANNGEPGDGIPTLKRAELGGKPSLSFTVAPLVEGIENMQIEYGVGKGVFHALPADVAAWRGVVSVKVHLLTRNLERTGGYVDDKTYTLGRDASGNLQEIPAQRDRYKRHVFQSQVLLRNPAGRLLK